MPRLGAVYPKIGDDSTAVTRVDFGDINSAVLTAPTATKATVTGAIAGAGFIAITINGANRNLITCLD